VSFGSDAVQLSRYPEVDLFDLLRFVWLKKYLVALIVVVALIGFSLYAFLSTPVYQARLYVLPPADSDIAALNVAREALGRKPYSVEEVYEVFTRNLQSEESLKGFFDSVYLPAQKRVQEGDADDELYNDFLKGVSVTPPGKGLRDRFLLNIESSDPKLAAEWTGLYVDAVAAKSLDEVVENAMREVEVVGRNVGEQIRTLKSTAKSRREDRVVQLKEALAVAESVGLENPPVFTGQNTEQVSALMDGNLLYMRGAKAIRAEMKALENRVSDDPFIPKLRALEENLQLYNDVSISKTSIAVFRMDGPITVPAKPLRPKRALLIAIGGGVGLAVGIAICLFLYGIREQGAAQRGRARSVQ
jgi:chain length determinant protein (polysaccharide antigen chain regulator)